ncbi:helix-turn-helix domain-containing protein [Bradyrhizobium barranii]|uniref:Helix-turn-helix domain-containing protein n=1 Tax=Bradyrhizobium barranii TaxID=2992140 RepID=A0ABY3QAC8_9BRAD|nr:helix-turn-helix domain-containing protein [Bradyrhizobium japonicum]UFW82836.1 helix-turn-helix domain-containing protein [Bradyrhizobium japonicum]
MSGTDVARYCGVTLATLSKWVAEGRLPPPLRGTRRWDRKALDLALDKLSGIQTPALTEDECPLEQWMREDAQKTARAEAEWERKYEARKGRRPP